MSRTTHHIHGPEKKYRRWEREEWLRWERKHPAPRHKAIEAELDEGSPVNVGGGLHSIERERGWRNRWHPEDEPLTAEDESAFVLLTLRDDEVDGITFVSATPDEPDDEDEEFEPDAPSLPPMSIGQVWGEEGSFIVTAPNAIAPRQAPAGTTCERVRVYDLARQVGVDARVVVEFLRVNLHEYVKGASSTVVRPVADRVLDAFCAPDHRLTADLDQNARIKRSMLADVEQFFGAL